MIGFFKQRALRTHHITHALSIPAGTEYIEVRFKDEDVVHRGDGEYAMYFWNHKLDRLRELMSDAQTPAQEHVAATPGHVEPSQPWPTE